MSKAKNGFYTIDVTDIHDNRYVFTDYLSASNEFDMPALKSPVHQAVSEISEVGFEWETVPGANSYKLEVFEADEKTGKTGEKVVSHTTSENAHTAELKPGKNYIWRVRARYFDPNDNDKYDNESRSAKQTFSTVALAAVENDIMAQNQTSEENVQVDSLKDEVVKFLNAWEYAWEKTAGKDGDIKPYIGYYSDSFSCNGLSKVQWEVDKAEKGKRKNWINVDLKINNIDVKNGHEEVEVDLEQKYRSSNYSDDSIKKLRLQKNQSGWKIISETTL
jgi:hypothetical protein